jgi:mannose-6-phosphate isomerase-like protein (cupin superfamily)
MSTSERTTLPPIVLGPDQGREYRMPAMRAVFKADGSETQDRYCVSEWWVDPHSDGPGAHSHESNDEIFYVTDGTASVLVGDQWIDAPSGTFLLIPAGTTHDFVNRTDEPTCLLNVFLPGGFETMMPAIMKWYEDNPPSGA